MLFIHVVEDLLVFKKTSIFFLNKCYSQIDWKQVYCGKYMKSLQAQETKKGFSVFFSFLHKRKYSTMTDAYETTWKQLLTMWMLNVM